MDNQVLKMAEGEAEIHLTRKTATYEPLFQPFILHTKNYVVQYNQLYLQRLELSQAHIR